MRLTMILVLSVLGLGCAYQGSLPVIPGHHWARSEFGADLFRNSDGQQSAHFGTEGPGPAQICPFDTDVSCHYFETDGQALEWLRQQYAGGR